MATACDRFLHHPIIVGLTTGIFIVFIALRIDQLSAPVPKSGASSEASSDNLNIAKYTRDVSLETLADLIQHIQGSNQTDLVNILENTRNAIANLLPTNQSDRFHVTVSPTKSNSVNVTSSSSNSRSKQTSTLITKRPNHESNLILTHKLPKDKDATCPYNFKVFVYPSVPSLPSLRYSEEARRNRTLHVCQKCILEQFSLEYIIYDFFTQFCGRTMNPDEADYFYTPMVRDAEYRIALESRGKGDKRAPSATEVAILNIIEKANHTRWVNLYQYTDKYWLRNKGFDHILVMPAPVTNFRHESSRRGFFHYMSHLAHPIFLCLEYSASFVREYPVCSTRKNIVMPYPSTDPDLFNGHLLKREIPRTSLLFYWGGLHGDCAEVRRAMKQIINDATRTPKLNITPPSQLTQSVREYGFRGSVFCPIPIGDSPSSKRMYDVMNFGCIPVVLSDDLVWAYVTNTGGKLNQSTFSIQLPQVVVQTTALKILKRFQNHTEQFGFLPSGISLYSLLADARREGAEYQEGHYINPLVQILQRIPNKDRIALQRGVLESAPNFRYYAMNSSIRTIPTATHEFPNGGAIHQLTNMLQQRKERGIAKLGQECQRERKRPGHKYIGNYPCEKSDKI